MPVVSSRTPEGEPQRCPVCTAVVTLEPSDPAGDAPCPQCGTLLWFVRTSAGLRFHEAAVAAPLRDRILDRICANLGADRRQGIAVFTTDLGADSLDIVELVMALEEEFEITIPDDVAERCNTLGDVIDVLLRRL
jgi:acyl carrier protein